MSFNFKTGGSWRTLASGWVKVAGTWQQVQSAWVKVAGTWQQVYTSAVVTLTGRTIESYTAFAAANAYLKVDNDGNTYQSITTSISYTQINSATDWVRPASEAPGAFEVRFTNLVGDTPSATAAEDVWHPLSSGDFVMSHTDNTAILGGKTCTFDLQIREGSGATLASTSYTLTADREDGA